MNSKNSLAIVILAAGIGSRMKSSQPKVMHKLAGKPMISWLIDTAESLKPARIIVVTGPDMQELQDAVRPHASVIQKIRNGTAGAVKAALPALKGHKGNVLILLGDAPLMSKATLQKLIKARTGAHGIAVLAAKVADPSGYGRLIAGKNGILEKIIEHKDASTQERAIDIINTGAFCIDGARLEKWISKIGNKNAAKEFYITDLPAIAARDGVTTKIVIAGDAVETEGCNTRADLARMEWRTQNILRARAMENGVSMQDPESVFLHHDTIIASDVMIEPHVFFGPGVRIETGAQIRAFSYIEGAKIGHNVSVGPFARLRPGSDIGDGVRIGNFVEIKKSSIGAGAKIGHLAYVGDCIMGSGVNFSAGAITVNYDGRDKHQTIIGDDAMIGSNVNLVAPVTIGSNAYIAAGSTITKNVPEEALAIERDQTRIFDEWAARRKKKKD